MEQPEMSERAQGPVDPLVLEAILAGVPPLMAIEAVASLRLDQESPMLHMAREMSEGDKPDTHSTTS